MRTEQELESLIRSNKRSAKYLQEELDLVKSMTPIQRLAFYLHRRSLCDPYTCRWELEENWGGREHKESLADANDVVDFIKKHKVIST